jgi:indole-3-glycerol phosphate synthase
LFAGAVEDAEQRKQKLSFRDLEQVALSSPEPLDVVSALKPRNNLHVIAEIKRASPSKGKMADIIDPVTLAVTYEQNGASAISVLTEERQFLGGLADLQKVSAVSNVPLLRKDFIANEYQILEARAFGASFILLIVAGLSASRLIELKIFAEEIGLSVFVETHSKNEIEIALEADAKLIGVNARDLSTFDTDRRLFESLASLIPSHITKVAESAVRNLDDAVSYRNAGADAVLVGEALVTGDAESLIRSFTSI